MNSVFIIGCGDTGRRLGALYRTEGMPVTGLVRSEESARELQALGIEAMCADLDADDLPAMPSQGAAIFYLAPPIDVGSDDVRVERLLAHLEVTGMPDRLLYMSTTGVYGDCKGRWIDEQEPANPATVRAQRRVAAEKSIRGWCEANGVPWVILRVPAIYGPGRLLTERLKSGLPAVRPEECSFTNRIHIDDLVSVCHTAMARAPANSLYNASDGQPTTLTDYLFKLADLTGLPRPPVISMYEAERTLSPSVMSFLKESKRIHNNKLLSELGVSLRYPDLASGLKASLADK
jgi:nucleoside-diphosphate-sugar epimerase